MEDDEPQEAAIDFVPAICFVPRGKAKEVPEKVILTKEELARVIKNTKEQLESEDEDNSDKDDDDDDENMDIDAQAIDNENVNPDDEFGFDKYDEEPETQVAAISDIVQPDEQIPDDDENDSEAEDEIIKPNDNLLLVGHVQDDVAALEVWVFNADEGAFYSHHDFFLPSFPLCIEWLSHDPGSEQPGNLCAIGCMDPVITIWDLDIMDPVEPTFKLGSKGSRRKQKPGYGHTDAVLDLCWNRHFEHILASGSVDHTLILWDLDEGQPHTTIKCFKEKVQSLQFHPSEAQELLTGCADGLVRLFDGRDPAALDTSFIKWCIAEGKEVEKVLWNPNDPNYFVVGDNVGTLYYADKRQSETFLWTHSAHEKEISGILFNNELSNLMTSTAVDGTLKVWNFSTSAIKEVYTHDFQMGQLQCMKQCPDDPFTLAFGGEKPPRSRIFNIKNFEAVRKIFKLPDAAAE